MTALFVDAIFFVDEIEDPTSKLAITLTSATRQIRSAISPHILMKSFPVLDFIQSHIFNDYHDLSRYMLLHVPKEQRPKQILHRQIGRGMSHKLYEFLKLENPTLFFSSRLFLKPAKNPYYEGEKEFKDLSLVCKPHMNEGGYLTDLGFRGLFPTCMSYECCKLIQRFEHALAFECNPLRSFCMDACGLGEDRYDIRRLLFALQNSSNQALEHLTFTSHVTFDGQSFASKDKNPDSFSLDPQGPGDEGENEDGHREQPMIVNFKEKILPRFFCDFERNYFPNLKSLVLDTLDSVRVEFKFEYLPRTLAALRVTECRYITKEKTASSLDWHNVPPFLESLIFENNHGDFLSIDDVFFSPQT